MTTKLVAKADQGRAKPISAAQVAIIETLLAVHSPTDAHAMLEHTLSGGVTFNQVRSVRKRMLSRGAPAWRYSPTAPRQVVPRAPRAPRTAPMDPSEVLRWSIEQLFIRKAAKLGCSVEAARIASLYSPAQIVRMNRAGAQGMI